MATSRRISFGLALLCLSISPGCWLDPTCEDYCDGDKIASCKWSCSGSGKLDVDECHKEYGGTDCTKQTGPSGKPMACRMRLASGGTSSSPFCIDTALPACEPGPGTLVCTGPHTAAECRATTQGGYAYPLKDPYCKEKPGLECHLAKSGINCVDSPKVACKPADHPRCLDSKTIIFCIGREGKGFYRLTTSCRENTCSGADGSGACR